MVATETPSGDFIAGEYTAINSLLPIQMIMLRTPKLSGIEASNQKINSIQSG